MRRKAQGLTASRVDEAQLAVPTGAEIQPIPLHRRTTPPRCRRPNRPPITHKFSPGTDWIKGVQEVVPWLANLPLLPKIIVSGLIVGAAAFVLALIWAPPPEVAVKAILTDCYRRSLFTRMHAQLDADAMFASIGECREVLQKKIPDIHRNSWLRVSGTTEMPQIDQCVGHQFHTVVPLLFELEAQQQPLEFIFPRKGPFHA